MNVDLEKLRNLRESEGLTLKDMADFLGYKSATGYHYLESGKRKFKPEHLPLLSQKFQVPMQVLFLDQKFAKLAN